MLKGLIITTARLIKSCFAFWRTFFLSRSKKRFIDQNPRGFVIQVSIPVAIILVGFFAWRTVRPVTRFLLRDTCQWYMRDKDGQRGGENRIAGIEAKRVTFGTTVREVTSIGVLKANAEVTLKNEFPGKITDIKFEEGAAVKKDQVLIQMEDTLYKAEERKCRAEFTAREAEFRRNEKLYEQNAGSKKTYDEALAHFEDARAQLEMASYRVSQTVIRAPFDGNIGILRESATPGNIVQQHTDLVTVVDNSVMRVEFSVPVKFMEDIAVGQSVEVSVDAFADRSFTGIVDAIDSEVNSRTHSVLVRAIVQNRDGSLRHGMRAGVRLSTGEKTAILVPEEALDREGTIEFVWIVDDKCKDNKRAYSRRVLTGSRGINGVEIVAGLQDGDIVVTAGQLKLSDGVKVKILNWKDDEEEQEKSADGDKGDKRADEQNGVGGVKSAKEQKPDARPEAGSMTELDLESDEQEAEEDWNG